MSNYYEQQPPTYAEPFSENDRQLENKFIQQITQWIPRDPFESQISGSASLDKPVAIPRVAVHGPLSSPLPFLRAYSSVLKLHDVHESEFVAFIDNLTVVQTAPAPLQALNIVGTGISFVPWHWTLAAGLTMNAAAIGAAKMITTTRTKRYLETVNRDYFAPRGLRVSLYKDEDLAAMVGFQQGDADLAPVDAQLTFVSVRDRRMQMLAPYIAPLSLDVPPPAPQRKMLDKISAKQVAHKIAKQEKRTATKQRKLRESEVTSEELAELQRKNIKKIKKMEYIVVEKLL